LSRNTTMPRVLVVEDEAAIAELVSMNLRHEGLVETVRCARYRLTRRSAGVSA